jgi:hypothetical protein
MLSRLNAALINDCAVNNDAMKRHEGPAHVSNTRRFVDISVDVPDKLAGLASVSFRPNVHFLNHFDRGKHLAYAMLTHHEGMHTVHALAMWERVHRLRARLPVHPALAGDAARLEQKCEPFAPFRISASPRPPALLLRATPNTP